MRNDQILLSPVAKNAKIALLLEESGLPYEVVPIDTRKGEQFSREFTAFNPKNITPAIVDDGVRVFDSTAILLYLSERTGKFVPAATPAARADLLSWLMVVGAGIGPYEGQAVHFKHFAPKALEYPVERYLYEARCHFGILDAQLSKAPYLLVGNYTIADVSAWGRARALPFILGDDVWSAFPHIKTWFDRINGRPAVQRVNALKDRFEFKTEMDDEARRHMFKHRSLRCLKVKRPILAASITSPPGDSTCSVKRASSHWSA